MSLRPVDLSYLDRPRRLLSYSLVVQAWVQLRRARTDGNASLTMRRFPRDNTWAQLDR